MNKLVKINKITGWILGLGIITTQIVIIKVTLEIGSTAPIVAIMTGILFLPFIIIAFTSVLNREKDFDRIKAGIKIGIYFQIFLSLILPFFFDKEFIYFGLIGVFLAILMWFFRKKIEIQLLILNSIGAVLWILISLAGLLSK